MKTHVSLWNLAVCIIETDCLLLEIKAETAVIIRRSKRNNHERWFLHLTVCEIHTRKIISRRNRDIDYKFVVKTWKNLNIVCF